MSAKGVDITQTSYFNVEGKPAQLKMNEAWNAVVDDNLSWQEQLRLGGRLGLLLYNKQEATSSPNASMLVIRNPEQPANNILRHAFRESLDPKFLPTLYDMLYQKNFNNQSISDKMIRDYVEKNIPSEVYAALKEISDAHVEYSVAYAKSPKAREAAEIEINNRIKAGQIKPRNKKKELESYIQDKINKAESTAKKEIFTVMVFQLVNSQYTLYVNDRHDFKVGATAEQARIPLLMSNMLANALYDQGSNGNIYDSSGTLTKVKPIPKGADSPLYINFVEKLNAIKPTMPFEDDKSLMSKLNKADEAATHYTASDSPSSSPPTKKSRLEAKPLPLSMSEPGNSEPESSRVWNKSPRDKSPAPDPKSLGIIGRARAIQNQQSSAPSLSTSTSSPLPTTSPEGSPRLAKKEARSRRVGVRIEANDPNLRRIRSRVDPSSPPRVMIGESGNQEVTTKPSNPVIVSSDGKKALSENHFIEGVFINTWKAKLNENLANTAVISAHDAALMSIILQAIENPNKSINDASEFNKEVSKGIVNYNKENKGSEIDLREASLGKEMLDSIISGKFPHEIPIQKENEEPNTRSHPKVGKPRSTD